jgi:hypothetical protein
VKAPPGEAGIAAARRLGRDPLVRTLSATEEVAALLTSRRCFTEVSHEAHRHDGSRAIMRGIMRPRRSMLAGVLPAAVFSIFMLAAVGANAGNILISGSDGDTYHGHGPYAVDVRDYLDQESPLPVLVLGDAAATAAYSAAVGGVGIVTTSSLASVTLSNFSALYLLSNSNSGPGCCEADVARIAGFEPAINAFLAAGGNFGIQNYTGSPGFDAILGTTGGANASVFGIHGGLGGTFGYDDEAVTAVGIVAGFANYAPLGNWGHQGFDMNFFGPMGFVSFIDAPVYSPMASGLIAQETELCFVVDAIDDQFTLINDGTTANLTVLANEECTSDTPISVVELPGDLLPDRGGSATTDEATVSYTPAAGFVGFEEFTYTAQDAGLQGGADPPAVDQDTATVVVDVLENLIPDAVDDAATTLQNQATIIDVLENDSLGNAPNEVAIETGPANGSATVQADDTIQYSPNSDFFGEDSFEYRLTDANGDSDVATVTVGVFFVSGQVPIDIMPNSDGNNLNLRAGQGAGIDIAILSVGEFFEAPNEIDPLTLKFGPREGNIWGSPQVHDVDGDGDEDLVVKFLIQQSGIPCGDTHANLFGRTFDFQPISGMDAINTFNCPRVRKRH